MRTNEHSQRQSKALISEVCSCLVELFELVNLNLKKKICRLHEAKPVLVLSVILSVNYMHSGRLYLQFIEASSSDLTHLVYFICQFSCSALVNQRRLISF